MTRRRLSIAEQVAHMRDLAPYMKLVVDAGWLAAWTGQLRPLQRTYTVAISYVARRRIGGIELVDRYFPVVRLVEPALQWQHPKTGKDVPHVYWDWDQPERSALCLYDPAADEWSSADVIAKTIVPWVCDWLICYEAWLVDGIWTGGGRHPRRRNRCRVTEPSDGRSPDQRERALRALFHSLGLRIGTSASFPLMVAASVGFSPPLSSRDWKRATLAAVPWEVISISSPAPQPEESLLSDLPPASPALICSSSMSSAVAKSFLPGAPALSEV
jgi:hypothetical protein